MKGCKGCGRQNDDAASRCRECGSPDFATEAQEQPAVARRASESDDVPLAAFAEREGNVVTLRCRTPAEAYLVSDELEKADIVTPLPGDEELFREYKRKGYVELRISAKAYESVADLRSVVEFQYKRMRVDEPLPYFERALAVGCAFLIVPGVFVFLWLLSDYRANGYHRKASQFKLWFFIGIASWFLLVFGLAALR